ncbi:MAG: hypothetical protein AAB583_00005 [Patescibacteria group bacterium]
MNLPVLENARLFGKTVFLRADLDVPLTKFEIRSPIQSGTKFETKVEDDTRLVTALPTIVKSYKFPDTENWVLYFANAISAGITLLTVKVWNF